MAGQSFRAMCESMIFIPRTETRVAAPYRGRPENVSYGNGSAGCAADSLDSTEKTLIFFGFPGASTTKSSFVRSATGPFLLRTMPPT
jgi:hypothetical protein